MTNKLLLLALIVYSIITSSCQTAEHHDFSSGLTFAQVSSIVPGKMQRRDIVKKIGSPSEIITKEDDEYWVYLNSKGHQQASLVLDSSSGSLKSVNWILQGNEPEINLHKAKARFPQGLFVPKQGLQTSSHALSDEIFYNDEKLGISIVVNETRDEVELITWFDTNQDRSLIVDRNPTP